MLHQGMHMLVVMEEGVAEVPPHIHRGTLGVTLVALRLVAMLVVVTVLMEERQGTVSCKEGRAGVLLLAPISPHSPHPWKGLPGMHSAAESFLESLRFL